MLFDLKYPIIQAPMAGNIVSPALVARVSNAGMLGSIASGYMSTSILEDYILSVKSLTNKPFLLNIFIEEPRYSDEYYRKPELIIKHEAQIGLADEEFFLVPETIRQEEYLEIILKHKISVVSTTFGLFESCILKELHQNQVAVIATVTSVAEALLAIDSGVDALVLQGSQAGGHQATFLNHEVNLTETLDLLHQVKPYARQTPLIIAGGIDLSNIDQYLATDAALLQLGTVFMLSDLSSIGNKLRRYITKQEQLATRLTEHLTGKWVRAVVNQLLEGININDYSFPIQHYATGRLRVEARKQENYDYSGIWLGAHGEYRSLKTSKLIELLQRYCDILK